MKLKNSHGDITLKKIKWCQIKKKKSNSHKTQKLKCDKRKEKN